MMKLTSLELCLVKMNSLEMYLAKLEVYSVEEHLSLAGLGGDEDLPRALLNEENCPEPDEDDLPGTVLAEDDLPRAVLGEDDLLGALLGGEGSLQKRRRR